jgi:hypothetical protein
MAKVIAAKWIISGFTKMAAAVPRRIMIQPKKCVCAHDAHDFSIDFFGKPMPS